MLKRLLAAAILLAAAGGLAFWAYSQVDDSAEAGVEVVRWGNVTVQVSDASGVLAAADYANTPDQEPVLLLKRGDSFVHLDAETGAVVQENIASEDRAAIESVLSTLQVSQLETDEAPWPYGSQAPSRPPERIGAITYIPPDPASGIVVRTGIADTFTSRGSFLFMRIGNTRSFMFIDVDTGAAEPGSVIAREDAAAFERFLKAIEVVPR